jgi:hypothetical protein
MARRKKHQSTEETQARHGRKKAAVSPEAEAPPVAPQQDPKLAEAEKELIARYPLVDVVPGSLRDGAAEGWGKKRIVTIRCVACNKERVVATSDLFHVYHCLTCAKRIRKEARKAQKEAKKEGGHEEH